MSNINVEQLVNSFLPKMIPNNSPALVKTDEDDNKTYVFVKDSVMLKVFKEKNKKNLVFKSLAYNKTYSIVETIDAYGVVRVETPDNSFVVKSEIEPVIYDQILNDFVLIREVLN